MLSKFSRRNLLKVSGVALASTRLGFAHSDMKVEPKLDLKALLKRGEAEWYSGEELKFIGMPVGGLFAGTLYLGGDGQLWNWDIFNQGHFGCVERTSTVFMGDTLDAMAGANYVDPVRQQSPFHQRFDLMLEDDHPRRVNYGDTAAPQPETHPRRVLFGDIKFQGEYPIGRVSYGQANADVEMTLEAFSPFCPQNVDSSSHPATTLTFQVTNTGSETLNLRLKYEVENPVLIHSKKKRDDYVLVGQKTETQGVIFSATALPTDKSVRPDELFTDWSSGNYGSWIATGTAFGDRPRKVSDLPTYIGDVKAGTEFVVNSHQNRNGEDVVGGDAHTGTLRSPTFKIGRSYINLRVGGGSHKDGTCVNLIVDGVVARTCTGRNSNIMNWESFPVTEYFGKEAVLEVVDQISGPWGQISLGEVIFSDQVRSPEALETLPDFGTFAVEFLGGANQSAVSATKAEIGRAFTLATGESINLTLVVAWHFPNCAISLPGKHNWYAARWKDASNVAQELISQWAKHQAITRAWNKTWYDSTLPHWFLTRTFVNTSILATTTCHRLDKGRFYFWEGIGCCAGTCTHVWGYAQAIGRVFPEVERYLRKEIDFGLAYHKDTGAIDYRAEYDQRVATDGQASCILRAYREHLMSQDGSFLQSIWPQVKGATEYLIQQDPNQDGILDGAQYNTLDTAWYGEIAWISSLYVAALLASKAMAMEMGDQEFAKHCGVIAESGSSQLVKELFNGEYFINKNDSSHPEANNTNRGCHIDQLYGQSWALQVGLPRVVPEDKAKTALKSLFKNNFYNDIWDYRRKNKEIPGGRWYATPGEGGLIMCSFPHGGAKESSGKGGDAWAVGYFNECMSGFEYQAANHMIAEGLVEEGLKVVHAIHQRYHPLKRNPYNEVECSDHYGRAMASYGSFIAMCGFKNNGPKHEMTFAPKGAGNGFRCAFINEQGWGVFTRSSEGKETVEYRHRNGQLS